MYFSNLFFGHDFIVDHFRFYIETILNSFKGLAFHFRKSEHYENEPYRGKQSESQKSKVRTQIVGNNLIQLSHSESRKRRISLNNTSGFRFYISREHFGSDGERNCRQSYRIGRDEYHNGHYGH